MIDINPTMSVMTLNVNSLNTFTNLKRDCQSGYKNPQLYAVYKTPTLNMTQMKVERER